MKIELPRVTSDKPNTGLVFRKDRKTWHYFFYPAGTKARRYVDLDLPKSQVGKARTLRDKAYLKLRMEGATERTRQTFTKGRRAALAAGDPMRYLTQVKPWRCVIGGKIIAEGDTEEEVRKARNKHLGIK